MLTSGGIKPASHAQHGILILCETIDVDKCSHVAVCSKQNVDRDVSCMGFLANGQGEQKLTLTAQAGTPACSPHHCVEGYGSAGLNIQCLQAAERELVSRTTDFLTVELTMKQDG